jgi:hypothetical protein
MLNIGKRHNLHFPYLFPTTSCRSKGSLLVKLTEGQTKIAQTLTIGQRHSEKVERASNIEQKKKSCPYGQAIWGRKERNTC